MRHVLRLSILALALFALLAAFAERPAFAQSRAVEAQARALQKKAMEEDYLTVDFDKATEKLNQAIGKCGANACSAQIRAALRRDLSTVQAAAGKKDEALASMTEALKIDPGLQLDPNYKTKDLEAIYNEAKKGAAAGGGAAGGGAAGGGAAPSGDFTHTPVPEQLVRTPVPIYAEYSGSEQLERVIAKYKGYGMTEYKSVELKKMGANGWGGTVPCADAQIGDLTYYLQGFNAQNDPVASGGDRNNPYRVHIKKDIAAEPPHLPGEPPPKQCAEAGECPPDFPGCGKGAGAEGGTKGEGEECEEDSQCTSNKCQDGKCTAPEEGAEEGKGKPKKRRKFWVGVVGSWDFPLLGSADDVCKLNPLNAEPINSGGYYCVNGDGSDYPFRPSAGDHGNQNAAIQLGKDDKVQGGIAPGNIRVMVSVDYAINNNLLAGVRLGYVLNTYPGSAASNDGKTFAPVHLEARATYVIGKDALMLPGARPYVFFGAGASEFDSSVGVSVSECPNSPTMMPTLPCGSPPTKSVNAWQIGGPLFVAAGGGVRLALGSKDPGAPPPRSAILVGAKLTGAIGGSAGFLFIPAPELGFQFGF